MKHRIEVPPELFAEWLAEGRKQYSEPALIAGFVAEKAAQYGADEQLLKVNDWIRCLGDDSKTGIRWELDIVQLDRLGRELWQAMRPKPPSLKEQALRLVFDYGVSNYSYTAEQTATIRRALESLPDADS
jgi:hypothetical protein